MEDNASKPGAVSGRWSTNEPLKTNALEPAPADQESVVFAVFVMFCDKLPQEFGGKSGPRTRADQRVGAAQARSKLRMRGHGT